MSDFVPYLPDDFRDFWREVAEEAARIPLSFRREPSEHLGRFGHRVDVVHFTGADGLSLQGWLAYPEGARREQAFLWIPPYGRESLLPNRYGTREGFVSMSLNLHGLGAFHQEKYEIARGYFSEGVLDPRTWIFRRLIQHVLAALRVLQAQSEADEDRIGVMGMSQGGGLSIWSGALSPIVKAVCADMPFLGAMGFALNQTAYRYPLKEIVDAMADAPLGRERALYTLSYYDTMNVATLCEKPTLVTLGEKDPACRPVAVRAIFAALATPDKRLIEYPGGHDWHEEMVANNAEWLAARLNGS